MTPIEASLRLARARGLGPRRFKVLVEHFGSAQAVLESDASALLALEGVGPALVTGVREAASLDVSEDLRRAEKLGLTLIALEEDTYPACLRAVYDPPPVLYVRGTLPELTVTPRSVAIVGTRDASEYALGVARSLGRALAQAGVHVVSGLALGVDTAAHEGSLSGTSGKPVAVLGSGPDVLYPRQNARLAARILEAGGAVVSEHPPGTPPNPAHFPARNRIVNGLSSGVVVVEAGQKSGALITADYALEEGRAVLAVPGRAGDPRASGALELLKQGASLVLDAADVLDTFGWRAAPDPPRPALPPEEARILEAVMRLGSPLLDDLMAATGLPAHALLPILTRLELSGVVRALPGGRYGAAGLA